MISQSPALVLNSILFQRVLCAMMNQSSPSAPILSLGYLNDCEPLGDFIKNNHSENKPESHSARLDSSLVVACHLDALKG
jgi:hypothetical protein